MSDALRIVQIGELIQTKNDKSKQLQSNDYQSNGVLPIVDQGAKPVCGYTNELSKRYDKGLPVIIFGDHTLHTKFIDFNFAIGADGTQVIAPKNQDCDTKYLYYLISRAANLIGSEGYKRHFKILKEFDIEYIEPLPEQQKIAAILSSVDKVIEKTRAQIDKLKDLKIGMMQELLTKGIGHTEFKDSPLGKIPACWEVTTLNEQLDLMTDYVANGSFESLRNNVDVSDDRDFAYYVRLYDLRLGLGHPTQKYVNETTFRFLKKTSLREKDILMANIGANVGEAFILPPLEMPATLAPNMIMFRSKSQIDAKFLYYYLRSGLGKKMVSLAISGSGQPKINKTDLKQILSLSPPHDEQVKIANLVSSIDTKIDVIKKRAYHFRSLKKALMQDLLTGKVRVNVDQKESAVA